MSEARDTTTLTWTFSNGEVISVTVYRIPGVPDGTSVTANGGLTEAAWALASGVGLGVAGNAAYAYLKIGIKHLRLALAWGSDEDKRLYFSNHAYMEVAVRVPEGTPVKVIGCDRDGSRWIAAVAAVGERWRVEIPKDGRGEPEVMMYVDRPKGLEVTATATGAAQQENGQDAAPSD